MRGVRPLLLAEQLHAFDDMMVAETFRLLMSVTLDPSSRMQFQLTLGRGGLGSTAPPKQAPMPLFQLKQAALQASGAETRNLQAELVGIDVSVYETSALIAVQSPSLDPSSRENQIKSNFTRKQPSRPAKSVASGKWMKISF